MTRFGSILITGGTGFFGHGCVRALLDGNLAARICIYSRDEYKQSLMREEFGDDPRLRWFIGDVRDVERLEEAMRGVEVVISAAALKRIEVGFYNPDEMYKTNIDGTRNVINASRKAMVKKVIFLSSDKAFQACSPYGISKAAAECAILSANHTRGFNGPIYAAVRYGNVWKSTGSIVPSWLALIERGAKALPVTDPKCTRFFMSRQEAVDLVLNTANTMAGGELVIPDLPAYRVGDLAEAFDMPMYIKGLPGFEKMHESMAHNKSSEFARRMTVLELRSALNA